VRPNPNESLLLLQAFMGAITLTSLALALLVSDSRRAERRLQTQSAISRVLAEAATLNEAAPGLLQALCREGPWQWAAIWGRDPLTQELMCVGVRADSDRDLAEFEAITRQTKPQLSKEFDGQTWKNSNHSLVYGMNSQVGLPRAATAIANVGDHLPGLIEMFSRAELIPDKELLRLWEGIGSQIGQFIERKEAEEAQNRLAAIVESTSDAIIGKTLEGIVINWNEGACRIFGYSAQEVLGKSIALIIPAERLEEEMSILTRLKQGEQVPSYETVRIRKDGTWIDVELTVSPIKDASGHIIGAAKIARDITEQKNTRRALAETREALRLHAEDLERRVEERTAKLQETIRSLDAFCYSIAHDLRGPLRSIIGFSAQLLDQYQNQLDELGSDFLLRIRNSGNRMDQLIVDLLKYGRLNTTELDLGTVHLQELVPKALLAYEEEIRQRQAQLRVRQPLHSVHASKVILEQVLANLLANALKFVPLGVAPQVEIWTENRAGRVRLSVRDNGIGIKAQYFSKLFRPFSRLVKEQDFSGTGIGLAIVSKGAERMGGSVGVESELGKGSCFWIELPQSGVEDG
jgi:PAS domain S-box-containing protein